MNKKAYCVVPNNHRVVDYYIGIINKSVESLGYKVSECSLKDAARKKDASMFIVAEELHLLFLYLHGHRNFIYWSQGVSPEESYMRNHSKLRLKIISSIEKFALKKANCCLLVSKTQMRYYENKYNISLANKSYVMPCYNCDINKNAFDSNDKYKKNVFCYAGGLAIWQCFKETAVLYKKIEEIVPNAFFKVLAPDKEKVSSILDAIGVKNYSVSFVDQSCLNNELAECKFGFIIREDTIVNNVATPTKLSTYLSNGLIPIITKGLVDFVELFNTLQYAVVLDNLCDIDEIVKLSDMQINPHDVYMEYKKVFDGYYSTQKHIKNIANLISNMAF